MPNYFLSEQTIVQSYQVLTKEKFNYETEFFYFLLLKHAGLNRHSFITLTDDLVRQKINEATKDLAFLFLSEEHYQNRKVKNNFINPFSMSDWSNQPSESIKAWSPGRLVNNVTGGGKQWKSILIDDTKDPNTIKLKHDYLNFFDGLNERFPLDAISVWVSKFKIFSREEPLSVLINNFYQYFDITDEEKKFFFSVKENVTLSYDTKIINPQIIRNLIGSPSQDPQWLEKVEGIDLAVVSNPDEVTTQFGSATEFFSQGMKSVHHYDDLLSKANQAIFMGPPGTSKSHMANEIARKFNFVKRIQFHPQYSYQDFIGGKILEKGNLVEKKGEFIDFLDKAMNDRSNKYLLVIEEINRANVSQVFGELIQLLDRNESLILSFNDKEYVYKLPENLKIVGTMNTTDRTVGRIDFAVKRRFYQVYFGVDYGTLIDMVLVEGNLFSVADLLRKINTNLFESLNNKEMVIGHAILLKDFTKDSQTGKYVWEIKDFANLFNYVLLPIVEDYCNGNTDLVSNVVGEKLHGELTGEAFVEAVQELISK